MKKLKLLVCLVLNLIVVSAIYIMCIKSMNPAFLIVMPVYQLLSILGICGYALLFLHHNNEIGKAKMKGEELDEALLQKRRNVLKWYIVIFFPFVAVTVCDYIYILLLADSPLFQSVLKFF